MYTLIAPALQRQAWFVTSTDNIVPGTCRRWRHTCQAHTCQVSKSQSVLCTVYCVVGVRLDGSSYQMAWAGPAQAGPLRVSVSDTLAIGDTAAITTVGYKACTTMIRAYMNTPWGGGHCGACDRAQCFPDYMARQNAIIAQHTLHLAWQFTPKPLVVALLCGMPWFLAP
jgi:hypothetical protein